MWTAVVLQTVPTGARKVAIAVPDVPERHGLVEAGVWKMWGWHLVKDRQNSIWSPGSTPSTLWQEGLMRKWNYIALDRCMLLNKWIPFASSPTPNHEKFDPVPSTFLFRFKRTKLQITISINTALCVCVCVCVCVYVCVCVCVRACMLYALNLENMYIQRMCKRLSLCRLGAVSTHYYY